MNLKNTKNIYFLIKINKKWGPNAIFMGKSHKIHLFATVSQGCKGEKILCHCESWLSCTIYDTVRLMVSPKWRLCSTSKFHAKFQSQLNSWLLGISNSSNLSLPFQKFPFRKKHHPGLCDADSITLHSI